jgi:beta-lactamase superfamily II metal-dependent hydrolase
MKSWSLLAALAVMVVGSGEARAAPPPAGTFRIHAIDVGTGLSVFVEGSDFTLLYDAGSNDDFARGAPPAPARAVNRVVAYLRAVRPDLATIDHVILSHPHKDHSELMPDVLAAYRVRNVWNSGALNRICSYRDLLANTRDETGVAYHDALGATGPHVADFVAQTCYGRQLPAATITVPRGSGIAEGVAVPLGGNAQMTFLHADGSRQSSFNENSLVVRVDLGTRRILMPGDSEAGGRNPPTNAPRPNSVEGELLACCAAALRSEILVAGHHGSMTSSRTAFLDAVGAHDYIVSAGPTRYGSVTLPDTVVVAEFDRRGTVWRTDLDDAACRANPRKIGPDSDGKPGGCDNILFIIDARGAVSRAYNRIAD